MEETTDINKSSDQSFIVILVIGTLLISSIYFIATSLNTETDEDLTEEPIKTSLSIPEAPSKPVQIPQQPKPKPTPQPKPKPEEETELPEENEMETEDEESIVDTDNTEENTEEDENEEKEKKESKPEIKLKDTDYKDETQSHEDPVYIIAEATSEDYEIERVEFYINDKKKKLINKREMHTKDTKKGDKDDLDKAIDKAKDFIEEEYDKTDVDVDFKEYFKKDGGNCDIEEGYLVILHTDEKYYDIRVSDDFDEVEECAKGGAFNYYDTYNFIFRGEEEEYSLYAKAYDTENNSEKTDEIEFELD